jgi:class 3 adenylate cyclase
MMRPKQVEGPVYEARYDVETLRKVTALASRLQSRTQEALTAREMEVIGAEVGLEPGFIQQALAQLAAEQTRTGPPTSRQTELWSLVGAGGGALLWGLIGIILAGLPVHPIISACFSLLAPAAVAALLGFMAGTKKAGFAIGALSFLAMAPTFFRLLFWLSDSSSRFIEPSVPFFTAVYTVLGSLLGGWLGAQGAKLRQQRFPAFSIYPSLPRTSLLQLLFTLQRQLEGQKQHRAFLSVDVVGSSEMKRSAPELAVEYSFGQYRAWVEEVVRAHDGEMQSAAGDGVMALFPTDSGALRAARQLQEGLPRFNAEQTRLPLPFRLRCGVSAGEVAMEEGTPLGHIQSPVIDRAAALQKRAEPGAVDVSGELAATALVELGQLVPLRETVADEPAFSWRPGQTAISCEREEASRRGQ